jgi:hypothetical protein
MKHVLPIRLLRTFAGAGLWLCATASVAAPNVVIVFPGETGELSIVVTNPDDEPLAFATFESLDGVAQVFGPPYTFASDGSCSEMYPLPQAEASNGRAAKSLFQKRSFHVSTLQPGERRVCRWFVTRHDNVHDLRLQFAYVGTRSAREFEDPSHSVVIGTPVSIGLHYEEESFERVGDRFESVGLVTFSVEGPVGIEDVVAGSCNDNGLFSFPWIEFDPSLPDACPVPIFGSACFDAPLQAIQSGEIRPGETYSCRLKLVDGVQGTPLPRLRLHWLSHTGAAPGLGLMPSVVNDPQLVMTLGAHEAIHWNGFE